MTNESNFNGAETHRVSNSTETLALTPNLVTNQNVDNTALKAEVENLKAKNEKLERKSSKSFKEKSPYNKVTEKFRATFGSQVIQTAEAKKAVFEKSLKKTGGITRNEFCKDFRDNVFNRLLANIKFVSECLKLGVNPFEAAQFIVMCGNSMIESVLKNGVEYHYRDSLKLLKGEIFSEEELAEAKFNTIAVKPTEEQLSEAQKLIETISQVLNIMGEVA